MKSILKIAIALIFIALLFFWYQADQADYFKGNYRDMTSKDDIFPFEGIIWTQDKGKIDPSEFYRQHFTDTTFVFPRQQVKTIKLFQNIPMLGVFTAKTLKPENNKLFIKFVNDTINFEFTETTWSLSDSEYYVRLYGKNDDVVGKIYLCLEDCGMTDARPFCPAMKYGALSATGRQTVIDIINDNTLWK
jgi:hypothetical protein